MGYYGGCSCGNAGCNGRHSIDHVTGRPIYVEDYVIPVFKGSTLTAEFEFPFTLNDNHTFTVVSASHPTLEDATITKISDKAISITWSYDIIDAFLVGSNNLFRVRVANTDTSEVKTYNEITIRPF